MKPEAASRKLLGITRAKAKMLEYRIPERHQHLEIKQDPAQLFTLAIGILGDLVGKSNRVAVGSDELDQYRSNLSFAAHFFDAYLSSKLNTQLDSYVMLLGSASYYLCELPGAASVLAKKLATDELDLDASGLERLLSWLLRSEPTTELTAATSPYATDISAISNRLRKYYNDGPPVDSLLEACNNLRSKAYAIGSPRELLLADAVSALVRRKYENSAWFALPNYSDLTTNDWATAIKKPRFIRELWPAQKLLGQKGILRGRSAVVQMPTSAGKTKSTELIIRSAFLTHRTSLAVIVAPFRALCHEIKNSLLEAFSGERVNIDELSDVLQSDFDLEDLLAAKQVLIVTPEKLLYVLRQVPEISEHIGLVIFDEGHQFDSGTRGITYELLLTTLRSMLPQSAQKVLISAVLSNAASLGNWLNGDTSETVVGSDLLPTTRSVGFASWLDQRGQIRFISNENPEKEEFFVPRVIQEFKLNLRGRETKERFFPSRSDGATIALFLGLKLMSNGSVAIFCGTKITAGATLEKLIEAFERGLQLELPIAYSDLNETRRLVLLHKKHLGPDAPASKAALLGVFSHYGTTPHGIRLAVEHAMRTGQIRFVVCTSTLAQGVNLPIRYLILTSVYQGSERLKVRDFHNLIGRAGRAGMHTEGSILFADAELYDNRKGAFKEKLRWNGIKSLLDPTKSEPCISSLLSLFEPIESDDEKFRLEMEALDFVEEFLKNPDGVEGVFTKRALRHTDKKFTANGVAKQLAEKLAIVKAIESFLMSNWDAGSESSTIEEMVLLSANTLAYHLADDATKQLIRQVFMLLASNVATQVPEPERRRIFGKTLFGVNEASKVEEWVAQHLPQIASTRSQIELLNIIWPLLSSCIRNGTFTKCDKPTVMKRAAEKWLDGSAFYQIHQLVLREDARFFHGKQKRQYKIDQVVELCETALAFEGALVVAAISRFSESSKRTDADDIVARTDLLQKMMKYGLPTRASIALYELGFSDRVVASDIAMALKLDDEDRKAVKRALRKNKLEALAVLDKYPSYFTDRLSEIV